MTTTDPAPAHAGELPEPSLAESTVPEAPPSAEEVLDRLRRPDTPLHLFKGFGPLVLAGLLIVVMMLLAPSVAPERIVERPVGATSEDGE